MTANVNATANPSAAYSFGHFRLITAERLLLDGDEPVPLTPKVFDTLVYLVENRGRLIGKDELMEAIWPGTFVNENNVNKNVSVLRKVLRESDAEQFIETVPKSGYRFVAPVAVSTRSSVHEVPAIAPAPAPKAPFIGSFTWIAIVIVAAIITMTLAFRPGARTPTTARQMHSLAVLPFQRLDATAGPNYLGLALADATINRLGYARRFAVRPTSSVERYSDRRVDALAAAKDLRVDGVVEGTIQSSAGRTRVTVQLISATDAAPVWSAKFDTRSADAFELEDLVGGAVARALVADAAAPRSPRHRPAPQAYDAYVRGEYYLSHRAPKDIPAALAAFQESVAADANFAAGHAGIAESYLLLSLYRLEQPSKAFPQSKAAAERALELDPMLAEAHGCLGAAAFYYDHDAMNAGRELRRALELNPAYDAGRRWYANYLTAMGRFDEAARQMNLARSYDPQSLMLRSVLGWHLFMARRYDEAAKQLQSTLDIDNAFLPALQTLEMVDIEKKKYDDAIALLDRVTAVGGESFAAPDLARIYAFRGDRDRAASWLRRCEALAAHGKVMAYDLASVYAAMGDYPKAIAAMHRSIDAHESALVWLPIDPRMDPLRNAPEFPQLLRSLAW